jgi:hypothetical protein
MPTGSARELKSPQRRILQGKGFGSSPVGRAGTPKDTFMDLHRSPTEIVVIFDADRNAYEAALSEGWPVARKRTRTARRPSIEPFSAFLLRAKRPRVALERIAA